MPAHTDKESGITGQAGITFVIIIIVIIIIIAIILLFVAVLVIDKRDTAVFLNCWKRRKSVHFIIIIRMY